VSKGSASGEIAAVMKFSVVVGGKFYKTLIGNRN
jgi:hypothetical protein